ncbi:prepilin peptidase [Agrococcus baldri]|uniref:prepilin peptidase n=1 Tax=Agrococcus baldri TaxID=153730 RepID=UPI001649CCF0|nr:prepilin peptidase [Agrococcus baldri]
MRTVAEAESTASELAGPRPPLALRPVDLLGLPLASAAAALLVLHGWDAVAIVAVAAAAAASPALARIDLTERRLPNALTLPLLLVALLGCLVRALAGDLAVLAALGCGAILLLMAITGGMGMGDVKLGTALALATATLGWAAPLAGLAASVVVGGIAGLVALVAGRRTVAFGPWLLVGHALVVVAAALRVM